MRKHTENFLESAHQTLKNEGEGEETKNRGAWGGEHPRGEAEVASIEKRKPVVGASKAAYLKAKAAWTEAMDEARRRSVIMTVRILNG